MTTQGEDLKCLHLLLTNGNPRASGTRIVTDLQCRQSDTIRLEKEHAFIMLYFQDSNRKIMAAQCPNDAVTPNGSESSPSFSAMNAFPLTNSSNVQGSCILNYCCPEQNFLEGSMERFSAIFFGLQPAVPLHNVSLGDTHLICCFRFGFALLQQKPK